MNCIGPEMNIAYKYKRFQCDLEWSNALQTICIAMEYILPSAKGEIYHTSLLSYIYHH